MPASNLLRYLPVSDRLLGRDLCDLRLVFGPPAFDCIKLLGWLSCVLNDLGDLH